MRRDTERDVAWCRGNEPTGFVAQVARQGGSSQPGAYAVGGVGDPDGVADTGGAHPGPVVGAGRIG